MLSRMTVLFSLMCLSLMWVACGDDEPGETTPDAIVDQDVGDVSDMAEVTPDVPEEPVVDVTPDAVEEPDTTELPEGACNTEDDCDEGQGCVGGGCVDPVEDLDEYAGEAAARPNSYTWKLQLPSLLPDREDCCFEYDGNDANGFDNALGDLLPIIQMALPAEQRDLQAFLDAYVENGMVTLVVDWTELPIASDEITDGDVRLSWFLAQPDPSDTWEARAAGSGDYYLESASFGDYGSLIQFNRAVSGEDEEGHQQVNGGPSTFNLSIPPIPGYFDEGLLITLQRAMIEADVVLEENGVHTEDETRGEEEEDLYLVGGGKLGGVVDAPQIIGYANDFLAGNCACAGVEATDDILLWAEAPNPQTSEMEFVVECATEFNPEPPPAGSNYAVPICCGLPDAPTTPCTDNIPGENCCVTGTVEVDCCSPDSFCTYIPMVCSYASIIGMVLDTDLNGNGAPDGLSAGLRFAWTGAYIAGMAGTASE